MTEAEALIALAEHDLEIARAHKALDELPEKRAILQLRHRLEEIDAVRAKAEAYCQTAERMVARSTDETDALSAKMEAEQSKVLSGEVTNPKELQSLTRELDALARKKNALESDTIALMEKAEAGAAQLAKVDATLAEGRAKEQDLIERFKQKGGSLQTEIERLRSERAAIVGRIGEGLVERYEALRTAKHGIAVGVLESGMCSACRTELPAERAQSLQEGPPIGECPNCRRILIVSHEA
jgi:hypothetical protein